MKQSKYLEDIGEIKNLMNRSSRFISLSGWSGIFAGWYALTGGIAAYFFLFFGAEKSIAFNPGNYNVAAIFLFSILILSIVTALFLSKQKAKKMHEKIWDITSKQLVSNFLIPLLSGGIFILILFNDLHYGITASLMLIFYGLALVNASKYTIGNIHYLGYAEILIGLLCALFPEYGFWFWLMGFGLGHIVYGTLMLLQERKA